MHSLAAALFSVALFAQMMPLSILFCVIVALTLFLVLDLDRPRRGLIRLNTESLLRLQLSLRSQP